MTEDHDQGYQGGQWGPSAPPAGWYQDPWDGQRRRFWDGERWTGDVSFEPPGARFDPPTEQLPASQASSQGHGRWPAHPGSYPTQHGGWGGWGQAPPMPPAQWGGAQGWGQPAPVARSRNRIHVAMVAVIAVIAVLAGVGIGSQINASSSGTASGSGGTGIAPGGGQGFTNPFGGGTGGGTGAGTGGSATLSPGEQSVANKVDKSVVDINTQLTYQNGAAAGTGMILTSNGVVLTNNHVIDGATSISVTTVSDGKTYKATVVGTDVTQDVAVLQMQDASGLTPIAIGNSDNLQRGQRVLAIGNAGGVGGTPSVVTGTVQALNQTITASDQNGSNSEVLNGMIQTDAPIQSGDSGGPLVNAKGQVIGMDTAASSSNRVSGIGNVGFAIPISNANTIATQIRQGRSSDKIHIGDTGFLGVSVSTGNSGLPGSTGGSTPGSTNTQPGASVANVIPGSPADKAGIQPGDTITAVDGQSIDSATALTQNLRVHHPGDQVSVTWSDQTGASHTATVTLAVGPAA